jgi:hypothetical protein
VSTNQPNVAAGATAQEGEAVLVARIDTVQEAEAIALPKAEEGATAEEGVMIRETNGGITEGGEVAANIGHRGCL